MCVVCVFVSVCLCMCTSLYVHSMCAYVYMYVHVQVYVCAYCMHMYMCVSVYVPMCKHMCVHGHCTLDFEVESFPELQLFNALFRCQAASGAVSFQSPAFQGEPQTL